jgi:hypothetical protein
MNNNKSVDRDFKKAILQYTSNLEALRDFVSVLTSFLQQHENQLLEERAQELLPFAAILEKILLEDDKVDNRTPLSERHQERLRELGEVVTEDTGKGKKRTHFAFHDSVNESSFVDAMSAYLKVHKKRELLSESSLLTLVSQAEWFQSQVISLYFRQFPDTLGPIGEPLVASEWQKPDIARSIIDDAIAQEVDRLTRGSLELRVAYLRDKIGVRLSEIKSSEQDLFEIHLRRNVIVHNGGIINAGYVRRVPRDRHREIDEHGKVRVSPEYLDRAVNFCEQAFLCVACELWRKCNRQSSERGDLFLTLASDALSAGRWTVAETLSEIVKDDEKAYSERIRMMALINYWQSFKWRGQFEKVKKDVTRYDFSAKQLLFRAGQAALLDDVPAVLRVIPELAADKAITRHSLETWPIFQEVRKAETFRTVVDSAFPPDSPSLSLPPGTQPTRGAIDDKQSTP